MENNLRPSKKKNKNKKRLIWFGVIVLIAALGGGGYYQWVYLPAQTTETSTEPAMQSASVRQGDLVIRASGAGSVVAGREISLGFPNSYEVSQVLVSVGDVVEAGQVLVEQDPTLAQEELVQAQRTFNELVSPAAIAQAKQTAAQAESDVEDAISTLSYQISPTVYYWEVKLAEAQSSLDTAKAENNAEAIAAAESALANAEAGLRTANYYYQQTYLPEYFTYQECSGQGPSRSCTDYVAGPSEAEIEDARSSLELAQALLVEAQDYLTTLLDGAVPDGATGADIVAYETALENLKDAQDALDNTQLVAPYAGTVTAVEAVVGEASGTGALVTIADLSVPYLEVYLDESDWDKVDIGYDVEVIFDAMPDLTFTGKVIQVDPFLTTSAGASLVGGLVELDSSALSDQMTFPIGMGAAVDVIGGKAENAILVPIEALRQVSDDQWSVFVVEDGELKLRVVQIGLKDIYYAEVLSGLEPGEVVSTGIVETE